MAAQVGGSSLVPITSTTAEAHVAAAVEACGDTFISMHVRRTDHWGSTITDSDFLAFSDTWPTHTVLIATDSQQTQHFFTSSLGDRARFAVRIDDGRQAELRQSSLHDAVVDMYTCAMATGPFKGTPPSSYSDTILRIRRNQGNTHPDDDHQMSDATEQARVTVLTPGGHREHSMHGMARNTYPSVGGLASGDVVDVQ